MKTYYKNKENDRIWWVEDPEYVGRFEFSFDKKRNYNLFADYPEKLSDDEKRIFDEENPEWVKFFTGQLGKPGKTPFDVED